MRKGVVSILTPAYNGEGLIHRLLDSVLRQTYPHVAMVVVNDGSTDRTEEVVKSYIPKFEARGYSLSIHNQPNGGQSNAINNGLKLVDGEYLVWPDCDDWYATDDAIAKLVARLAQYGDDVGVSRCAYNKVNEGDFKIICTYYTCMGEEPEYVFEKSVLCRPCFWFTPGGWMLKAKFLDELIPGREIYQNKSAGQNAQLLWPYLFAKKCVSVEEPMFNYLVRGESAGQVRLSIETDQEFDALELYSTGALTLKLGDEVTVYYAFIESADQDCGNPGEECMELLTNANYGAKASFSLEGLLSVTNQVQGLGFIVDNDMETYSTITVPVNLANAATIDVTFNTIKANQEVGFVLSDIPGLADVDLVKIVQVKAFYNDEFVGGSTDGTGVDLKLFGSGDKKYFGITPGKDFNRLQLVTGDVLGVLSTYHVNGIYLKPDHDGDGVMDCVMDYASTEIVDLKVIPEDICLGDGVEFDVSGGVEGVTYTLNYYNQNGNTTDVIASMKVQINETGGLKFLDPEAFHSLGPGEYYISVVHGDYELNRRAMLTIHPNETEWTGKKSNDWNNWENWTEGTPWECTNVFIPKSATYPNLCKSDQGNGLCCNNIHFAPGAELVGQHLLNYVGSVFIDTKITAGKYQLMSVPLQGMVTGDMFVASNVASWEAWRATEENGLHDRYFRLIDDDGNVKEPSNYMEQRKNPFVFQRFWSKEVSNKSLTRASTADPAIIQVNDWSRSFNAVGTPYALGQGFAMRLDGSGEYTFHFPKKHNAYFYYDKTGTTKLATD